MQSASQHPKPWQQNQQANADDPDEFTQAAEQFKGLFSDDKHTLERCRARLRAASEVKEDVLTGLTLQSDAVSSLNTIIEWINECSKVQGMTASDLRRTVSALERLRSTDEYVNYSYGWDLESKRQAKDQEKQRAETEKLVANYNALLNQYNSLVDSFNALRGYAIATSAGYDQMKTQLQSCTYSSAVQQMIDTLNAQRPTYVYTPPPQRVNVICSTIDLGGIYSTSCQ